MDELRYIAAKPHWKRVFSTFHDGKCTVTVSAMIDGVQVFMQEVWQEPTHEGSERELLENERRYYLRADGPRYVTLEVCLADAVKPEAVNATEPIATP